MKIPVLLPQTYSLRQVALMVQVAMLWAPDFAGRVGESRSRIPLMAAGLIPPTPAVLRFFELETEGDSYLWNPR